MRRLIARLSSEELELLTRLSVMGSTFRRDQALALAEKLERLPGAAFRFDSLLGPWIEPSDATGYHRLSPLLDDSTGTLSPARRADLEVACAVALLENAPVYVHDAARALQPAACFRRDSRSFRIRLRSRGARSRSGVMWPRRLPEISRAPGRAASSAI